MTFVTPCRLSVKEDAAHLEDFPFSNQLEKLNPMNRLLLILSVSLLSICTSCQEQGINPTNCREGKCSYAFEDNSRLRILPPVDRVQVAEGDSLVFTYEYIQNDKANVQDDEYSERIWFQIDPSLTEFSLRDEELASVDLVFLPDCECLFEITPILNGTLSGKRLSTDLWEITMDVSYTWNSIVWERSFTEEFGRKE